MKFVQKKKVLDPLYEGNSTFLGTQGGNRTHTSEETGF